jgi:hypothetical protein
LGLSTSARSPIKTGKRGMPSSVYSCVRGVTRRFHHQLIIWHQVRRQSLTEGAGAAPETCTLQWCRRAGDGPAGDQKSPSRI